MFPKDLVLVRHGQSEGNVAVARSREGDHRDYTAEFVNRHSGHFRLTTRGQEQARVTGEWLKANGLGAFDHYYVSEYARAVETAARLDLPNAQWYVDFQIRERDHGLADVVRSDELHTRFAEHHRLRATQLFYTPWPDGESMAQVCDRLRGNIVTTLHRECADKRVIIVSHGDVMRAFRVIFERMLAIHYHAIDIENPKHFKIGNGQVIHYTRVNPEDAADVRPYFGWVRSVNPPDPSYGGHGWQSIGRQSFSNQALLALADRSPRLLCE